MRSTRLVVECFVASACLGGLLAAGLGGFSWLGGRQDLIMPIALVGLGAALAAVPAYFIVRPGTKKYLLSADVKDHRFALIKEVAGVTVSLFVGVFYIFFIMIDAVVMFVPSGMCFISSVCAIVLGAAMQLVFLFWVKWLIRSNKDVMLRHALDLANAGQQAFTSRNYGDALTDFELAKEYFEDYKAIAENAGAVEENIAVCDENIKMAKYGTFYLNIASAIDSSISEIANAKRSPDEYDRKHRLISARDTLSASKADAKKYGFPDLVMSAEAAEREVAELDGALYGNEGLLAKEKIEKVSFAKPKAIEMRHGDRYATIQLTDDNVACESLARSHFGITGEVRIEDARRRDVTYMPIGTAEGPLTVTSAGSGVKSAKD